MSKFPLRCSHRRPHMSAHIVQAYFFLFLPSFFPAAITLNATAKIVEPFLFQPVDGIYRGYIPDLIAALQTQNVTINIVKTFVNNSEYVADFRQGIVQCALGNLVLNPSNLQNAQFSQPFMARYGGGREREGGRKE